MWNWHKINVNITPAAVLVIWLFILVSDLQLLAALCLAAACHEMGHYVVLRLFNADIKEISFTVFGAEMKMADAVGYGAEWLSVAAGPGSNLLLAVLFSLLGKNNETWYLFSGAQAVLGVFNLLPIRPLDGGNLLWITVAVLTEPYTADTVCRWAGFLCALLLATLCLWLFVVGGGVFPLLAGGGLLGKSLNELGLVKGRRTR